MKKLYAYSSIHGNIRFFTSEIEKILGDGIHTYYRQPEFDLEYPESVDEPKRVDEIFVNIYEGYFVYDGYSTHEGAVLATKGIKAKETAIRFVRADSK